MIHRVFFDTNILLDVLTEREPFFDEAAQLWSLAEKRQIEGLVSALSLPTAYYLLRHAAGHRKAITGIKAVRSIFDIVTLDQNMIDQAIGNDYPDLEDGIQACAALRAGADCIVTRDPKGFRKSDVPVLAPGTLIASLNIKSLSE